MVDIVLKDNLMQMKYFETYRNYRGGMVRETRRSRSKRNLTFPTL